ncbi:MAG TPA: hypothetical protein VGL28_12480 [Steroidobacteraceae bacterium]|jgi:hypothetical protein
MSFSSFIRYLLLPARPTVLLLIAMLTLGLLLASQVGLFGIVLQILLLSWLLSYGYVLLERIANGAAEPPVLAVEMLNPVNEPRALLQVALVVAVGAGLHLLAELVNAELAIALACVALLALPASIGALGAGDARQAANPVVLWRIMQGLGVSYLGIVLAVILEVGALLLLAGRAQAPGWLLIPVGQFAWLSLFALIGGALYEQRLALGYEPIDSPERRAQRAQRSLDNERSRFLDRVYGEARGGNLAAAWDSIERELAARDHAFDFYDWLLERLTRLPSAPLAARLAQDYIRRALGHDNARVIVVARRCVSADADFHPRSSAETLRVAELARLAGDRVTARALLAHFERHFPGDAAASQAARMAAQLRRD